MNTATPRNYRFEKLYRLLTILILATSVILPAAHAGQGQQIIATTDIPQLIAIAKSEGYVVSIDEDGDLLWKIEGFLAYILVSDDGEYVQFQSSFEEAGTSLEKVNAWNQSKRYSRSYIDSEGDPVLELDLDLEGGVTHDRIVSYLQTCNASFRGWLSEVID